MVKTCLPTVAIHPSLGTFVLVDLLRFMIQLFLQHSPVGSMAWGLGRPRAEQPPPPWKPLPLLEFQKGPFSIRLRAVYGGISISLWSPISQTFHIFSEQWNGFLRGKETAAWKQKWKKSFQSVCRHPKKNFVSFYIKLTGKEGCQSGLHILRYL